MIVEDDAAIRSFVTKGLREEGHVISSADNGKSGLDAALADDFDVIILDLMLPRMDGIAVCRALREKRLDTPILILTAKGAVEDRVQGLDAGADDYLVKPFAFSELLARVRALGRRKSDEKQPLLDVAGLRMDLVRHKVSYEGQELELTTREFTLLEHLMRRKGHVLSRTMIIESVWGYDFNAGTNIIDVYINFLRRKLRKLTGKEWIRTLRSRGYVFEEPAD